MASVDSSCFAAFTSSILVPNPIFSEDKIIPKILLPLYFTGHDLEEIRVRALHNIISKLDYGTIDEKELLLNEELVCRLFDWLVKFDASPEKEKILRLLLRILNVGLW